MENFLFMAFSKGEVSTEAASVKRYVGVAPIKILAVNPTKAQLKELAGYEPAEEPVYTGKQEVDGKPVDFARVTFLVQTTVEPTVTTQLSFFVRNQYRKGSASGKYEVIDNFTNTAWGAEEVIKKGEPIMYSNGPAKLIGEYRPAYVGEYELIRFIREYLVLGSVGDTCCFNYVNGSWIPMEKDELENNKCYFTAEEVQKMFKGDFSAVKDAVALQPNNEVKAVFGVRNVDGREYQDVYPRVIRKKSSKVEIISDAINERKQAGGLSNVTYEFTPLHEYVVTPTDFSNTAETESPW